MTSTRLKYKTLNRSGDSSASVEKLPPRARCWDIPLGGTAHEYMPDPDGMHGLTKRKQKEMEACVRQISNMSQSPVQFIYVMVPNVDDRQRGG